MKLKKKQQEFIKKAYNSNDVCQQWKDDIKKNFPKLFKETDLVVGEWYFMCLDTSPNKRRCLFNYKNSEVGKIHFNYAIYLNDELWEDDDYFHSDHISKPATKEEVETALIAEAKRRGFKEGVKFYHSSEFQITGLTKITSNNYEFNGLELFLDGWTIFSNGNWATIQETITKAEAEKQLNKTII